MIVVDELLDADLIYVQRLGLVISRSVHSRRAHRAPRQIAFRYYYTEE